MRFAGGAAVFPAGGSIRSDFDFAANLGADGLDEIATNWPRGSRRCAKRLEETGLAVGDASSAPTARSGAGGRERCCSNMGSLAPVLEAMGWTADRGALIPFARWWPKHREIRVFDTRFYLADLGTGAVDLLVDATENTHLFWASAAETLAMADSGKIKVIFPTRRNLERLAQFGSFAEVADHAAVTPVHTVSPWREVRDDGEWLCIRADAGYPVTDERLETVMRG